MPHKLIPGQVSLVPLLKLQMAPRLVLLMSSGSKKKEPRYTCRSEDKDSHSQKVWAEISSSAPHLLHKGLLVSPIKWRCFLRVLCDPVRWPITTLDCILLKDKSLVFVVELGPVASFPACLSIPLRQSQISKCWLSTQPFIFLLIFWVETPKDVSGPKTFEQNRLLLSFQRSRFLVPQQVQGPNTVPLYVVVSQHVQRLNRAPLCAWYRYH